MKKPERVDGFGMNKLVAFDHPELCIVENVESWFKIMIICEYQKKRARQCFAVSILLQVFLMVPCCSLLQFTRRWLIPLYCSCLFSILLTFRCPWTGTGIGRKNMLAFKVFVVGINVLCYFSVILVIVALLYGLANGS